jgi:hypothetical protein
MDSTPSIIGQSLIRLSRQTNQEHFTKVFNELSEQGKITLSDLRYKRCQVLHECADRYSLDCFRLLTEFKDADGDSLDIDDLRERNSELLSVYASSNLDLLKYLLSYKDQYGQGFTVENRGSDDYDMLNMCIEFSEGGPVSDYLEKLYPERWSPPGDM